MFVTRNRPQSKVSIVISCYNKADYVGATLQSVYNQIWDNIELILVNNGSTDGSLEILREWEPKLKARGHEVVLISHENIGLPAAIHGGILRITGDYFCTIDADDEIYPEYVSTMAGWLDEHPEHEFAACSYIPYTGTVSNQRAGSVSRPANTPDSPQMLENYVLFSMDTMVWIYLVRTSYLRSCRIIENFCNEPRLTHEPLIAIPLAGGGGRCKYFPEPLYKYNVFACGMYQFSKFEQLKKFYEEHLYLQKWAIRRLNIDTERKRLLLSATKLAHVKELFSHSNMVPDAASKEQELAKETAVLINTMFEPSPQLTADQILKTGYRCLFIIADKIICNNLTLTPEIPADGKRIIGYGALGKIAGEYIPLLMGSSLQPDILWDRAAKEADEICGLKIYQPDFDMLNSDDIVLVFPKNEAISKEIAQIAQSKGINTVLFSNDIQVQISRIHFPQLYNNCRFIGEQ